MDSHDEPGPPLSRSRETKRQELCKKLGGHPELLR